MEQRREEWKALVRDTFFSTAQVNDMFTATVEACMSKADAENRALQDRVDELERELDNIHNESASLREGDYNGEPL